VASSGASSASTGTSSSSGSSSSSSGGSSGSGSSSGGGGRGGGGGGAPRGGAARRAAARPLVERPPPAALVAAQRAADEGCLELAVNAYRAGVLARGGLLRARRSATVGVGADPGAHFVMAVTVAPAFPAEAPRALRFSIERYYHLILSHARGARTHRLWLPQRAHVDAAFRVPTRTADAEELLASLVNRAAQGPRLLQHAQTQPLRRHALHGQRRRATAQRHFWRDVQRACGGRGAMGAVVGSAHVGNVRGHRPGPWRQMLHVLAQMNAHGYTALLWEFLTTRVHSVCRRRMAEVHAPWYAASGSGWAPGEPFPAHATVRMGGLMYCEGCGVFVVRDDDAASSMRDIDAHYLRGHGRLAEYSRANVEANPEPFVMGGRMRGVPEELQGLVDALPVELQAMLLYAVDLFAEALREGAFAAL
jgi:hypothetical protein